ncbi:hypothetical protein [Gemmatimonas sp.]
MRLLRTLCHTLVMATLLAAHRLDGKPTDALVSKKLKDRIIAMQ